MQGDDVKEVQQALKKASFMVNMDGIFTNETEAVAKQFQQAKGLRVDGIIGPATRAALSL